MDHFRDLGDFAAGDSHSGQLGSPIQALRDLFQEIRVGRLDGDVVQDRQGLSSHTQHIVDIHGHTINPHGVVFAEHLCDQKLRPHSIGGERQPHAVTQIDDVGKIAERQLDFSMGWPQRKASFDPMHEARHDRVQLLAVDPRRLIAQGIFYHAITSTRISNRRVESSSRSPVPSGHGFFPTTP